MALPISAISSVGTGSSAAQPAGVGKGGQELPFAEMIKDLIQETNNQQGQVEESVKQLITGETDSIHDVVLTASQADLAFRLVMEIRDRLIASYQEVMRMQM
ncbi:MAG: flagellar hook-basal body complex protein FliE [Fuerstiella sp.]|nr:flagellar hook-basal body complex protein FliE [Fuerstiella sp.]MCP4783552.1 flagellar hook-basal body complex protein FliE [Fuerstiella sp.]MCP4857383.1 flagellar hook-basal body complex protein FliE [Fuerstiella sp.]